MFKFIADITPAALRSGSDDITGFDETVEKQLSFFDSLNYTGGLL